MEVEIPKSMLGKNLAEMSPQDIQKLMDSAREEAIQEVQEEDSTLTLGALGAPYQVGEIDITVAIGNLVLLNEINSPFITGEVGEEGEELNATECIKSLYVLANGKEVVKPIMAIKQRIQALTTLKPMVENNPELFQQLMERAEKIAEAHADFELKALEWYGVAFAGWDFQEVINQTFAALTDVLKSAGDLPSTDEKKN